MQENCISSIEKIPFSKKGLKLTTVLASVNNNPNYYMFIPKQILFWKHFNIRFLAIFVGTEIPHELLEYKEHIILWNYNLDLNSIYIAQNIRIYYPALLKLPENEIVMITDMDMLPMTDIYYKFGLEKYEKKDFIYYRHIDNEQIYICYNAATPSTWSTIFEIETEEDIQKKLLDNYSRDYSGIPGNNGWFTDQCIMYNELIKYSHLKVLDRKIRRLEIDNFKKYIDENNYFFINQYDDCHFHRNYFENELFIVEAEKQLFQNNILNKFTFYKGLDIVNQDISYSKLSIEEIAFLSCLNPLSDGFNTLGFIKKKINIDELISTNFINVQNNQGIYVKKNMEKKKRVLTFSLWGNIPKYTIGAIKNAELAKHFYPDFECWFYIHEESVSNTIVEKLMNMSNVKIIFKYGDLTQCKPMMWRFEAIDDENVEVMLSRDTDTRILLRERFAVEEWLNSDCVFHIMRDHPHHNFHILGGMFGTRKIYGIKWIDLIEKVSQLSDRDYDQQFLANIIYPRIKDSAMIHASFHKYEGNNCRNFPIDYSPDFSFVGQYVYDNDSK
jgi:hypothetical protein